jgi:hypothetical protein
MPAAFTLNLAVVAAEVVPERLTGELSVKRRPASFDGTLTGQVLRLRFGRDAKAPGPPRQKTPKLCFYFCNRISECSLS